MLTGFVAGRLRGVARQLRPHAEIPLRRSCAGCLYSFLVGKDFEFPDPGPAIISVSVHRMLVFPRYMPWRWVAVQYDS